MTEGQNNVNLNENLRNDVNGDDQQETLEVLDFNTWTATGDMQHLPTKIFKDNTLNPTVRKTILQTEPRNKDISFEPPIMDKKLWNSMSRQAKEQDKNLRRAAYRFSSVVRPVDNTLRLVYASRPNPSSEEQFEAWLQLEQTVLNNRALVLDALSFVNELRQEQALKTISPTFHKPIEKEEVFGAKLNEAIRAENESNKLLNEAAVQRKKATQNRSSRGTYQNSTNFRPPTGTGYRNKGNKGNSWKDKPHTQGNFNQGGQTPRQS